MGAAGSGRTKASREVERVLGASLKHQTEETQDYTRRLRLQAGDRAFSVDRKYSDGSWFTVGEVADSKESTVGETFGGGIYRVYEINKATEERIDRPPLVLKLSPTRWKIKKQYATPPQDLERDQVEAYLGEDADDFTGGRGAGAGAPSTAEIAARIEAKIRRELEREARFDRMEMELKNMAERVAGGAAFGGAQPQGSAERMAEIRELLSLVKELQPPPAFNGAMGPTSPLEGLRQSLEVVRAVKTEMGELNLGGEPKGNPILAKLTDSLVQLGQQALVAHQATRATPAPVGLRRAGAVAGAPAGAVQAPARSAPAEPTKEQLERDYQAMMYTLSSKLAQDQADQLSADPKTHISETAAWIQAQWSGDDAPTVWSNLRKMFREYSDDQVVGFLGLQAPTLADTPAKKNWLASLVELIRKG